MNRKEILNLTNQAIQENESLFLVDFDMDKNNKITIVIDGDNGVPLKECIRVNRYIENELDREEEDYSLEVSSPDIAQPIKLIRQYNKNIGKIIQVKTETENFEGKLIDVKEDKIVLSWKAREPKPIGKGKVTVEKQAFIAFNDIIQSKVKIVFN
ncbi:MAG TPA: ribosome assembly cofactor RimP [Flavobacteriia bacterium]|nr:ribosome assembly cofactor RimP [Flavobacteriia bacterium]